MLYFRKRLSIIDTIPTPAGVGLYDALRALAVPLLSRIRPTFVPALSHFCAAPVCVLEASWNTSITTF
jgi:hypothetical protein